MHVELSFHFQKITGTLKTTYIFLKLQIPSFYIKEHSQKRNFEIKNFEIFYFVPQNRQKQMVVFDLEKKY